MARARRLATLLLAALPLLVGCGQGAGPHHTTPPTTTVPAPAPAPVSWPVTVDIPAIGVHATHLQALGLAPDGTVETPALATPQVLGYYQRGGHPCEPGPSPIPFALIGHIDGHHQQGVLYKLKSLKAGDTVTVGLDNGHSCTYRINQLAEVSKTQFPTQTVWGPTPDPQIRIISCGGQFVGPPLYYKDNLVGMGTLG